MPCKLTSLFTLILLIEVGFAFMTHDNGAHGRYIATFHAPLLISSTATYTSYHGNGSVAAGWPAQDEWLDFSNMWYMNKISLIDKICDNSAEETAMLFRAIAQVAAEQKVDDRFVLSIVMEESRGCVRVGTTSLSVSNPGLMQSYEGKASCVGQTPCPWESILQMIEDGTAPNKAGVDLKDLLAFSNMTDVSCHYMAARMYNSGKLSIGSDGDLSAPGANACYAADIANRLRGYVGESCGEAS